MSSAAPKPSPPPVGGGWCSFSLEKSVSSRPKPPSSVVRIGEKGEIGVAVARKLRRRAMFIGRPAPHESLPSSVAACERVVLGGIACGSMPLLVKFMPLQRSLGDLVHDPGYKHGAPDGACARPRCGRVCWSRRGGTAWRFCRSPDQPRRRG